MSSSAFITYPIDRSVGEGHDDEDGADPGWGMSAWGDTEFGPWLLGNEVLRGVEAYWQNQVDKGRVAVGRGRGGES